jgi:hypothetical protein
VAAQPRHVSLDQDLGKDLGKGTGETTSPEEEFEYSGIVLRRKRDGSPVDETWLPMGEDPSHDDDERLIAALHEAWLWTTESERDADTLSGTL